ncbi:fucose 4-O-acetylase [Vibrio mimicus]|nr:fucose 4-O-acetylase [Vibrio mimicus]KAA3492905.1 acyltransferase [Vibrio mimicus]
MPSVVMSNHQKIASLELGRVIAMLAIIALHCQLFTSYWLTDEEPWVAYLFNQSTRFAVPLFFLISGYLIHPKLSHNPMQTLRNYCSPLLRIWVIWSMISLLMPFNLEVVANQGYLAERSGYWGFLLQHPLNSLFEGGLVHLWFLPALMIAVAIMALLIRQQKTHWMLPIAIGLYIYGEFAGSSAVVTGMSAPIYTRNGPFFSTLFVVVGYLIRERHILWKERSALLLALVGMLFHFVEAYGLHQHGQVFNTNDYLFGTALWAIGLFLFLLAKPDLGRKPCVFSLSQSILGFYVSHLLMVIVMMNIAGILGLAGLQKDALILFGTLITTYLLVKGLERTPLKRVLLR